jgi:hypothetical protein
MPRLGPGAGTPEPITYEAPREKFVKWTRPRPLSSVTERHQPRQLEFQAFCELHPAVLIEHDVCEPSASARRRRIGGARRRPTSSEGYRSLKRLPQNDIACGCPAGQARNNAGTGSRRIVVVEKNSLEAARAFLQGRPDVDMDRITFVVTGVPRNDQDPEDWLRAARGEAPVSS